MNAKFYEKVSEKFIQELKKGVVPWNKPWTCEGGNAYMAISWLTGKPYSLSNQCLLGFEGGEYLTFAQVKKAGGRVRKGAHSSTIIHWSVKEVERINSKGETELVKKFIPSAINLFHLKDTEGVDSRWESKMKAPQTLTENNGLIDLAERVIKRYLDAEKTLSLKRVYQNEAYYRPSTDEVITPLLEQFECPDEYYGTTFHELVHSTKPESRCNRSGKEWGFFGSAEYSKEELVAEIGSAMILKVLGINTEKCFKNSVSYISGWLSALSDSNNVTYVFDAAKKAEKAVKYILGDIAGELEYSML